MARFDGRLQGVVPIMSERKYTVSEIAALRRAVDNQYLWGSFSPSFSNDSRNGTSRVYKEEEKAAVVEERVRTYMLAGVTADDLYASERQKEKIGPPCPKAR